MHRIATFAFLAVLFSAAALASQPIQSNDHSGAKKEALQSVNAWLKLVDDGKNDASWRGTSTEFQTAVSQEKWTQMSKSVRAPLGAVNSRQLQDSSYNTSLPGAPDGQYVVLRFGTSFANKNSAIETVVMSLQNGQWLIAGYFIK
jgi:hypothetical protein